MSSDTPPSVNTQNLALTFRDAVVHGIPVIMVTVQNFPTEQAFAVPQSFGEKFLDGFVAGFRDAMQVAERKKSGLVVASAMPNGRKP